MASLSFIEKDIGDIYINQEFVDWITIDNIGEI
jgi:hypothetical protein